MENKAIRILSLCLIALFALAVIFFAVGLIVEYKKAPNIINSTLNQFASDVSIASEYYTPGTQQFSDVLRARIASNRTIAVVTIAQDNNVIFAYPLSSPFITQGVTGQPTITASSSFVSIKNKELILNDETYIVSSALYSLQPAVIYSYIRISFLVVLAGTLVAGIALMYLYLIEQKKEELSAGFDDEKMAQRLRNSKLDFPDISSSNSIDVLNDEDFNLNDEGDSNEKDAEIVADLPQFDEYNLPEDALQFPPPDLDEEEVPQNNFLTPKEEVLQEESFFEPVPQKEDVQERQDFNETPNNSFQEASLEEFVAEDLTNQELDSTKHDGFSDYEAEEEDNLPPIEVDFSEIDDNSFVIEDYDSFDENIGLEEEPEETIIEDFSEEQTQLIPQANEVPFKDEQNHLNQEMEKNQEEKESLVEQDKTKEPAGLFSPVTGFGWEAYLEERLDSELARSAESGEDIGLMIVRIQDLDKDNPNSQAIYKQLLDIYKFKDLIFEYGTDGFSCIVHSINVDGALKLAERVYMELTKVLEANGMTNEIGIGISTRSFRLIPAKRIYVEAEQALIHAFEDPETAIVAFRVDPEKYRQYISEKDV